GRLGRLHAQHGRAHAGRGDRMGRLVAGRRMGGVVTVGRLAAGRDLLLQPLQMVGAEAGHRLAALADNALALAALTALVALAALTALPGHALVALSRTTLAALPGHALVAL